MRTIIYPGPVSTCLLNIWNNVQHGKRNTHWTANSLVGVRMRTLIAWTRFGRNSNLSRVGNAKAAVCKIEGQKRLRVCLVQKNCKEYDGYRLTISRFSSN